MLCEDGALPYVFIQSKVRHGRVCSGSCPPANTSPFYRPQAELGAAAGTQRPTSVVLVSTKAGPKGKAAFDGGDRLKEVLEGVAEAAKGGDAAEGGDAAADE